MTSGLRPADAASRPVGSVRQVPDPGKPTTGGSRRYGRAADGRRTGRRRRRARPARYGQAHLPVSFREGSGTVGDAALRRGGRPPARPGLAEAAQPQRVADHGDRAGGHVGGGEHGRQDACRSLPNRVTTQGRALRVCGPELDDMNAGITAG